MIHTDEFSYDEVGQVERRVSVGTVHLGYPEYAHQKDVVDGVIETVRTLLHQPDAEVQIQGNFVFFDPLKKHWVVNVMATWAVREVKSENS